MSTTDVGELRLSNGRGVSAVFTPFGARLVELRLPDREGRSENVVLGFDDVRTYAERVDLYFGATIGRVAGRISGSSFELGGRRHPLARNEGSTHLHGGPQRAFDRVDWSAEELVTEHGPGIRFSYVSPDGEEGYPGTLRAQAEYSLSERDELWTVFRAVADAPTPVNMTNHAYWNLQGAGSETVLDHELTIAAGHVVAMGEDLVPTGGLTPVAGGPLDFRAGRRLGERLPEDGRELWPGFDAAYVLDPVGVDEARVSLWDPVSGRAMDIVTSEPSIQMYTANRVPEIRGRDRRSYRPGNAICLEPQRMPDAVNRPEFAPIVLHPGEEYLHVSRYRFSVR